jgi:hypothetical protein
MAGRAGTGCAGAAEGQLDRAVRGRANVHHGPRRAEHCYANSLDHRNPTTGSGPWRTAERDDPAIPAARTCIEPSPCNHNDATAPSRRGPAPDPSHLEPQATPTPSPVRRRARRSNAGRTPRAAVPRSWDGERQREGLGARRRRSAAHRSRGRGATFNPKPATGKSCHVFPLLPLLRGDSTETTIDLPLLCPRAPTNSTSDGVTARLTTAVTHDTLESTAAWSRARRAVPRLDVATGDLTGSSPWRRVSIGARAARCCIIQPKPEARAESRRAGRQSEDAAQSQTGRRASRWVRDGAARGSDAKKYGRRPARASSVARLGREAWRRQTTGRRAHALCCYAARQRKHRLRACTRGVATCGTPVTCSRGT